MADLGAELAADLFGVNVVMASFGADESIGPMDERSLWTGLLFFFLLDETMRAAKTHLDESTVPP